MKSLEAKVCLEVVYLTKSKVQDQGHATREQRKPM
jgi:hypothetical protein